MSNIDIQIHFDGAIIEASDSNNPHDYPTYRPQSEVKGNVLVYPNQDIRCRKVTVQVLWYTAGRGTQFEKVLVENIISEGNLMQGVPISNDFSAILPDDPWSFGGRYIQVLWCVSVKVDVPMGRDIEVKKHFILEPDRSSDYS